MAFPPIPERAPRGAWKHTSTLLVQNEWVCRLLGVFFLRRPPLLAQINVSAVWTLWLESKFTTSDWHDVKFLGNGSSMIGYQGVSSAHLSGSKSCNLQNASVCDLVALATWRAACQSAAHLAVICDLNCDSVLPPRQGRDLGNCAPKTLRFYLRVWKATNLLIVLHFSVERRFSWGRGQSLLVS